MKINSKETQHIATIVPSLICADLCNLERDVQRIEALGCKMLHVDILDGRFSPSMPIGLDTVRQLKPRTAMAFDAHVMSISNDFFVNELLEIGAERICFQIEHEATPGPLLEKIRNGNAKAGIALAPATPISVLKYIIEECDFVLLMQINPGYASLPGIEKKEYMHRKFIELRELIEKYNPNVTIEVDGRVSVEDMPDMLKIGVHTFVSGTSGLFHKGSSWEDNWNRMMMVLRETEIE